MSDQQTIQHVSPVAGSGDVDKLYITLGENKLTTLTEIRRARTELQTAVTVLITNFEKRTLCPVMAVTPRNSRTISGAHDYWDVEVKL